MFKTAYTAMFQSITPTESVCQQVLATMQAEEARQMPTILPAKRAENHRPVWTLVACAAMVTVAVALTWVLTKEEKPPVLPGTAPTIGTETSVTTAPTTVDNELPPSVADTTPTESTTTNDSTTENNELLPPSVTDTTTEKTSTEPSQSTTTTTVDNGLRPPSVTNTIPTGSTTVTPPPTTTKPDQTTPTVIDPTTTITTTTTTTKTENTSIIGTLPTVGGYNDLFQWAEVFTTTVTTIPTVPTEEPTTSGTTYPQKTEPSASKPPDYPMYSSIPKPSGTEVSKSEPATTTTALPETEPTRPYAGTVTYQHKTTSNTTQEANGVFVKLIGSTVMLFSPEGEVLSKLPPSTGFPPLVESFCLYQDRLVMFGKSNSEGYTGLSAIWVYDISDPTSPRLLKEMWQDGSLVAAHHLDGVVYIISYYVPNIIQYHRPESYIPRVYPEIIPFGTHDFILLKTDQILLATQPRCNGYTVLTAFSLEDLAITSTLALYGQANQQITVYEDSVSILSKPYVNGQNQTVTDRVTFLLDKGQISRGYYTTK